MATEILNFAGQDATPASNQSSATTVAVHSGSLVPQVDDLVIVFGTYERSNSGPMPSTSNGDHPTTGHTFTCSNLDTGTPGWVTTGWVDLGFARGGNGNQQGSIAFGKYLTSTDFQSTGSAGAPALACRIVGSDICRGSHARMIIVRGASATLSDISAISKSSVHGVSDTSTEACFWTKPSATTYVGTATGMDNPLIVSWGGWRRNGSDLVTISTAGDQGETFSHPAGTALNCPWTLTVGQGGGVSQLDGVANVDYGSGTTFKGIDEVPGSGCYSLLYFEKHGSFNSANADWGLPVGGDEDVMGWGTDAKVNGFASLSVVIPETVTSTDHPFVKADSTTTLDTLSGIKASSESRVDSSAASDSFGASQASLSTSSDTSTTLDSLSVALAATESNTDSSVSSDTLTIIKSSVQGNTDSSTTSDSLVVLKSAVASVTDSSTAADIYQDDETSPLGLTDSTASSDALSAIKASVETSTDPSEASDALTASKTKVLDATDSSSSSDTLSAQKTSASVLSDGTALADALVAEKTAVVSLTDSTSASDIYSDEEFAAVTIADSSASADSLSANKSSIVAKSDSASALDDLVATKTKVFEETDSSSALDSLVSIKNSTLSVDDSVSSSDLYTDLETGALLSTDASLVSDSLVAVQSSSSASSDASLASDSLVAVESGSSASSDASLASDSLVAVQSSSSASSDASLASDSLIAEKTAALAFSDSAVASDVYSDSEVGAVSEVDPSSVADSLSIVKSGASVFSDSASASDSYVDSEVGAVSAADASLVSDSLVAVQSSSSASSDASLASDSLVAVESGSSASSDASLASDSLVAVQASSSASSDASLASDSLIADVTGSNTSVSTDASLVSDSLVAVESGSSASSDASLVSDSLVAVQASSSASSDASLASDSLIADVTGSNTSVSTDASLVSDSLVAVLELSLASLDYTLIQDSLTIERGVVRYIEDFVDGSAAIIPDLASIGAYGDGAGAGDYALIRQDKDFLPPLGAVDTAEISDVLSLVPGINRVFVDSVMASDALLGVSDKVFVSSDLATTLDALAATGPVVINMGEILISGEAALLGSVGPTLLTEGQALVIVDIWNTALNTLGISTITTTTGTSPQQTLLNAIFPLFRKQFLTDHVWNGAKKTVDLTALAATTATSAVMNRWDYAYQLPSDVLRVWRLNGLENRPQHIGGNPNIHTNVWEIEIVTVDSTDYRALLTNQSTGRIEYVFDVGDTGLSLLGPLAQHAMGVALAAYVAPNFGKSTNDIAVINAMAKEALTAAKGVDGQEGTPQMMGYTSLLGVRSIGD